MSQKEKKFAPMKMPAKKATALVQEEDKHVKLQNAEKH
jgi:hypothetical protein